MQPRTGTLRRADNSGMPTLWDILFLVMLACVLVFVSWVGTLNYRQGMKTEVTKHHGRAWLDSLTELGPKRGEEGFEFPACAGGLTPDAIEQGAKPEDIKTRWGECQAALIKGVEALGEQENPFTGEPFKFVSKCDPSDRGTSGAVLFEKILPTPPGSAQPTAASHLAPNDSLALKTVIRVTVCGNGADPIRIGEVEF
jgi:hypothetical protein